MYIINRYTWIIYLKEYTRLRWRIYLGRPMIPPCLRTDWEEDRGHKDTLTDSTRETDWLAIVPPLLFGICVCACGLLACFARDDIPNKPNDTDNHSGPSPLNTQDGRTDPRFLTCLERLDWYAHRPPDDGRLTYGSANLCRGGLAVLVGLQSQSPSSYYFPSDLRLPCFTFLFSFFFL